MKMLNRIFKPNHTSNKNLIQNKNIIAILKPIGKVYFNGLAHEYDE